MVALEGFGEVMSRRARKPAPAQRGTRANIPLGTR